MLEFVSYAALGGVSGVLAGLLGIGGGTVIVPALAFLFAAHGIGGAHAQHLALGTSMASIVFTSVSSLRAHHARGAVDWRIVRDLAPAVVLGTLAGSWVVSLLPGVLLKAVFVVFAYVVGVQMLFSLRPEAGGRLPARPGMLACGGVIGLFSSFVGIGGGTLSVPFMTRCSVPMHVVVGTSAAIGLPIAIAGTVGFVAGGLHADALPPFSLGFVYLPALAGIASFSIATAPLGAWLAHALPVKRLKQLFAVVLLLVGTRMLAGLL